jgi:hypothetical protein
MHCFEDGIYLSQLKLVLHGTWVNTSIFLSYTCSWALLLILSLLVKENTSVDFVLTIIHPHILTSVQYFMSTHIYIWYSISLHNLCTFLACLQ